MNARTATVLESDQDAHAVASATRGILAAADDPTNRRTNLKSRARKVAAVASAHAAAVDRESRLPAEAIAALRAEKLLGIMVPRQLGGEGASLTEIADICYTLGRACASTAMIYAMHQTKVACIVRHGHGSTWHERLQGLLAGRQLLLASSTTEGHAGGDVRNSTAPIEHSGSRIRLKRRATVISYGAAADGVVTTARRTSDAASSDQVLAVFLKDDYELKPISGWDAFGMRGTCSEGFELVASGEAEQILPAAYDKIHVQTMMPVAHLLWSSTWAGIAAAAMERARDFVRKAVARSSGGALPPSAAHLTRASASLRTLRSLIAGALRRFEVADLVTLETVDFQTGMNLLKVNASELAVVTVMSAMQTCGLAGYRNDGEFSIGRYLRDILSSPVMINNDRIMNNIAAATLLAGTPDTLCD